jgi:hypothetical protein
MNGKIERPRKEERDDAMTVMWRLREIVIWVPQLNGTWPRLCGGPRLRVLPAERLELLLWRGTLVKLRESGFTSCCRRRRSAVGANYKTHTHKNLPPKQWPNAPTFFSHTLFLLRWSPLFPSRLESRIRPLTWYEQLKIYSRYGCQNPKHHDVMITLVARVASRSGCPQY